MGRAGDGMGWGWNGMGWIRDHKQGLTISCNRVCAASKIRRNKAYFFLK